MSDDEEELDDSDADPAHVPQEDEPSDLDDDTENVPHVRGYGH